VFKTSITARICVPRWMFHSTTLRKEASLGLVLLGLKTLGSSSIASFSFMLLINSSAEVHRKLPNRRSAVTRC